MKNAKNLTVPAPVQDHACRRCTECPGQAHHWMEGFDEDDEGELLDPMDPRWQCKHCEFSMPYIVDGFEGDDDGEGDPQGQYDRMKAAGLILPVTGAPEGDEWLPWAHETLRRLAEGENRIRRDFDPEGKMGLQPVDRIDNLTAAEAREQLEGWSIGNLSARRAAMATHAEIERLRKALAEAQAERDNAHTLARLDREARETLRAKVQGLLTHVEWGTLKPSLLPEALAALVGPPLPAGAPEPEGAPTPEHDATVDPAGIPAADVHAEARTPPAAPVDGEAPAGCRWYSYDPSDGEEIHDTAEQARHRCEGVLEDWGEDAEAPSDAENLEWGLVVPFAAVDVETWKMLPTDALASIAKVRT
jgi:hypothetical protein